MILYLWKDPVKREQIDETVEEKNAAVMFLSVEEWMGSSVQVAGLLLLGAQVCLP